MEDYRKIYYIRKEALEKARLNYDHKERIRRYKEHTIYNPSDYAYTPEIIKNLRSAYRGNTLENLNDLYFDFLQKIQKADKANNITDLLFHSQISLFRTVNLL